MLNGMLYLRYLVVTLFFISLCSAATSAQCRQPEREALMKDAEQRQFTLRRVVFIGLTYTPDEKMRKQMSKFNEGDIFSRTKLVESMAKMNRFRNEIYPVRLTDVMLHLDEPDKTVDMTICFRPKRR